MTGTILCAVCGTVNVGVFARCIACGQALGEAVDSDDPGSSESEGPEVPLQQTSDVSGPAIPPPPPPPPRPLPSRPAASARAGEARSQLESASHGDTVIEMPRATDGGDAARPRTSRPPSGLEAPRRPSSAPPGDAADEQDRVRYSVRVLLPEGDRRTVEVGRRPVLVGSGLDELGLPGDPRATSGEARLHVEGDRLVLDPSPNSQNVYVRIDKERKLRDGDVVLMGDVAAVFTHVDPGGAVDGSRQVLGGSANAACGRLVFLRRDGSPGPVHDLPAGKTVVGRTDGHLNFPGDSRLSRRHVLFFASDQGVTVEDLDSRNGTYLRVRERCELKIDDALRVGSAGIQIRARGT